MSAIFAMKLTKRLGFGMLAKMLLPRMHVAGKVLLGCNLGLLWYICDVINGDELNTCNYLKLLDYTLVTDGF
ncbi:hypothetical protein HanPSC8_Chr00c170g0805861 [Helianthus annuus]|nr:hypothetical protein HanPSC8_Chr00c170g0805861 [Helianthus annuus]